MVRSPSGIYQAPIRQLRQLCMDSQRSHYPPAFPCCWRDNIPSFLLPRLRSPCRHSSASLYDRKLRYVYPPLSAFSLTGRQASRNAERLYGNRLTLVSSSPSSICQNLKITHKYILRTLAVTIILTLASLSPFLKHLVPDIEELEQTALGFFHKWAFPGSSVESMRAIATTMSVKRSLVGDH